MTFQSSLQYTTLVATTPFQCSAYIVLPLLAAIQRYSMQVHSTRCESWIWSYRETLDLYNTFQAKFSHHAANPSMYTPCLTLRHVATAKDNMTSLLLLVKRFGLKALSCRASTTSMAFVLYDQPSHQLTLPLALFAPRGLVTEYSLLTSMHCFIQPHTLSQTAGAAVRQTPDARRQLDSLISLAVHSIFFQAVAAGAGHHQKYKWMPLAPNDL